MATTLYPGIAFSPQATLTNNIGAADTIIEVSDVSAFPPAPNLATIGTASGPDEEVKVETILYTAKTQTALSGCQRGVEGTARTWMTGELIGRNFTAKDYDDLIAAVGETGKAATAAQEDATAAQGTAEAAGVAAAAASSAAGTAQAAAEEAKETAEDLRQRLVNKNLLINYDFRNPVNRNGKNEYAGVSCTVDGWFTNNPGSNVTLEKERIKVFLPAGSAYYQPSEISISGTYTLSFLFDKGSSGTIQLGDNTYNIAGGGTFQQCY